MLTYEAYFETLVLDTKIDIWHSAN